MLFIILIIINPIEMILVKLPTKIAITNTKNKKPLNRKRLGKKFINIS